MKNIIKALTASLAVLVLMSVVIIAFRRMNTVRSKNQRSTSTESENKTLPLNRFNKTISKFTPDQIAKYPISNSNVDPFEKSFEDLYEHLYTPALAELGLNIGKIRIVKSSLYQYYKSMSDAVDVANNNGHRDTDFKNQIRSTIHTDLLRELNNSLNENEVDVIQTILDCGGAWRSMTSYKGLYEKENCPLSLSQTVALAKILDKERISNLDFKNELLLIKNNEIEYLPSDQRIINSAAKYISTKQLKILSTQLKIEFEKVKAREEIQPLSS